MKFSTINEINTSRDLTEVFGGYNHNLRINEGEFYDMKNLTSSHYPVLSPRCKRGTYAYATSGTHSPHGLISKDALCYVDGTTLYINNVAVAGLTLTDTPKQLISMGAYIIIMPDKKYINTKDITEYGNIEASFNSNNADITATYTMCKLDGTAYSSNIYSGTEPPTDTATYKFWIDTSSTPHVLKQYSSTNSVWSQIATTYVKIAAPNIASSFKQYDGVMITGIPEELTQLKDLNGQVSVLYDAYHDEGSTDPQRAEGTNDYIIVVGFIDEASEYETKLKINRSMPLMDFIIESNNRLWGCRYGTNASGEVVNEIYASKQGDFKNWNCFMGISTDSYAASCGTDGQWTGAINHLGYPIFFKENCLHKVYGNYPSNYQIQTTECRGVMKGAGNSLAIVNEALYYKSRNGVCAYDGSLPSEISSAFGEIHYSGVDTTNLDVLRNGAVAGSHHNKYYISMKSEVDSLWYLFVYDTTSGMWHKEDNTRADAFCSCNGEMYYIDHTSNTIKTILGSGTADTSPIEWMAETGILGTDMPDKKYISRLLIRMSLAIGSRVMYYIQYDSCGEWEYISSLTATTLRSFTIPIRPHRCDHLRLRIVGTGDAKIFSITKTTEQGSDA